MPSQAELEWRALERKHSWQCLRRLIYHAAGLIIAVLAIHLTARACVDTRPVPALIGTTAAEMGVAAAK